VTGTKTTAALANEMTMMMIRAVVAMTTTVRPAVLLDGNGVARAAGETVAFRRVSRRKKVAAKPAGGRSLCPIGLHT